MNREKRRLLEQAGWRFGDAEEFLDDIEQDDGLPDPDEGSHNQEKNGERL
jgi:hypothetical protein